MEIERLAENLKNSTTALIAEYLDQQGQTFKRLAQKTSQKKTKQNIHELRVTTRRIDAALWLIGHETSNQVLKKLPVSLRKLRQALGKCRELDVALEDASKYHFDGKKLKSQRQRASKKLRPLMKKKLREKIENRIQQTVHWLGKHPEVNLTTGFYRLRSKMIPMVRQSKPSNKKLHELRIDMKKTRYALEAIGKPIEPLRRLQGLLGRGHDLQILQGLLGKNKKIDLEMGAQFKKAKGAIGPALRFAIKQLNSVLPKPEIL